MRASRGRDEGQAVLLVLPAVAIAAVLAMAAAHAGATLAARAQAQTAADAAALAGVDGGVSAAQRLASRNGATVTRFSRSVETDGVTVEVTVRIDDVAAQARATDGP